MTIHDVILSKADVKAKLRDLLSSTSISTTEYEEFAAGNDKVDYKKWKDFSNLYPLMSTVTAGAAKLLSSITSREVSNAVNDLGIPGQDTLSAVLEEVRVSPLTKSLKISKTHVVLELDSYEVQLPLAWNLGEDTRSGAAEKQEQLIRAIFPKFKMPTSWTSFTPEEVTPRTSAIKVIDFGNLEPSTISFLRFIHPDFMPFTRYPFDTLPEITLDSIPNFEDTDLQSIPYFRFELMPENSFITVGANLLDSEAGDLNGLGRTIVGQMAIKVTTELRFPKEFALWATSAKDAKEFNPALFHSLINKHVKYNVSPKGEKPPIRVSTLTDTVEASKERMERLKYTPKVRSNGDGFTIRTNGAIAYLPKPDIKILRQYEDAVRTSYDAEKGEIVDLSTLDSTSNRHLYTDWYYNRLVYSNISGNVQYVDITGCIALDNLTIARWVNTNISNSSFAEYIISLNRIAEENSLYNNTGDPLFTSVSAMYEILIDAADIGGLDLSIGGFGKEAPEEGATPEALRLFKYAAELERICREAHDIFPRDRTMAVSTYMFNVAFMSALVNVYGSKRVELTKEYKQAFQDNKAKNSIDELDLSVPNLPGLEKLLHHQGSVVATLMDSPKAAILDVAPGGGKTVTQIIDAVLLLEKAKAHRCALYIPSDLVAQFVDDINFFSNGEINAVPITHRTVRKFRKIVKDFDSTWFVNWVKSYPINTLFVISTSFVKARRDMDEWKTMPSVLYGSELLSVLPNTETLQRCEFDYASIDESHEAKNLDSQRTQALSNLRGEATYRRIASGSIISNTSTDLVGQMALINPAIFGSKENFVNNFAAESKGNKILRPIDDAGAIIRDSIRPYSPIVTKRRRDWAWLLPTIKEAFQLVRLNSEQQAFYDKFMENTIKEILGDSKLRKKLSEGNEQDAQEIERALRRYLARVEMFINAPGSNAAFAETVNDPESLVSPKVAVVDDLIDAHFNGGTVGGIKQIASEAKVIVFGYNKVVSKHMYEYTRHKGISVHYTAGDTNTYTRFLDDPNVKVIFADETSLNTGKNMQVASRLIRLQTLWSPGDQDQAISRVLRPDPKATKQRGVINFDWIITEYTLEIGKTARLLSKIIDKAQFDEAENPRWRETGRELESLPLISMSLDTLKEYNTADDLRDYYGAYTVYKNWEDTEFERSRQELQRKLSQKYGRDVDMSELASLSSWEVKHSNKMQGSASVYTPFTEGQKGFNRFGVPMKSVAFAETESDDDDDSDNDDDESGDSEDQVVLEKGQYVYTEFGISEVLSVSPRRVSVRTPTNQRVSLWKSIVYVPVNDEDHANGLLKKYIKDSIPNNVPELSAREVIIKTSLPKRRSSKEEVEEYEEDESNPPATKPVEGEEDGTLEVHAGIINGKLALYAVQDDGDVKAAVSQGWKYMSAFNAIPIKNWRAMEKVVDVIGRNFKSNSERTNTLQAIGERLRGKGGKLMQANPDGKFFRDVKNFFLVQHRKVPVARKGEKPIFRGMGMVWDGQAMLIWNAETHNPRVTMQLRRHLRGTPGIGKIEEMAPLAVRFFTTTSAAQSALKKLNRAVEISNLEETMDTLDTIIVRKGTVKYEDEE